VHCLKQLSNISTEEQLSKISEETVPNELQYRKHSKKVDADVQPLNRPYGTIVNDAQSSKQLANVVTDAKFSNNPDGTDVNDEQFSKHCSKVVTDVQLSNKPDGIEVNDVQFRKQLLKPVIPLIPVIGPNIAVTLFGLVMNLNDAH